MNKNIRISLAIFIIAALALISGRFEEVVEKEVVKKRTVYCSNNEECCYCLSTIN